MTYIFHAQTRRQDSSIGFGAPVRANMRSGGITNSVVASSLLESVSTIYIRLHVFGEKCDCDSWCLLVICLFKMLQYHNSVQVESGDLIAYGLIPEFIGRFPILVSLSALNEDQLVQVMFWYCMQKASTSKHLILIFLGLLFAIVIVIKCLPWYWFSLETGRIWFGLILELRTTFHQPSLH